jgi:putative ABC transport system permease protein
MNYRYIWNELRHHRHRTLVNILGIGIGIALFVSINAVSAAYKEAVSLPFKSLGADIVVQRPEKRAVDSAQAPASMRGIRLPFSNQLLPVQDLQKLRSIDGVDSVATSLLLWDFEQRGFRIIMGVNLDQPSLGPVKVKEWLKEGRFAQNQGEVVLEKHYAKFQQTKLGDSFQIGDQSFKVVGLMEIKEGSQIASANIYLSLADAQTLLPGEAKGVNLVYLRLKNPSFLSRVKTQIAQELSGVSVTSSDSFLELMGGVSKISDQFSLLASIVALGGAIFLIIKTMLGNLVERSREVGILKAVGWTGREVQKQLMGEVLLQSLMGGILGIVAGYAVSYLLGFFSIPISTPWEVNLMPAFAKDTEAASQVVRLPVSVSYGLMAISLVLSMITGGLASYLMGRRISGMKPAEILRKM